MSNFSSKCAVSILALMGCLAPQMVRAGLDGEPAPVLNINQWIKGQPVEIKPGTNIYVVEIFSTSAKSMASRTAVTNLNYLQNHYRTNGVIIVGVCEDGILNISNFVYQSGLNIDYWIAADNKRYTGLTYMNPVMQRGVPYAFLVGTNADLLWHGSPMGGLGGALDAAVKGKYDEELAKKDDLANHQLMQYLALAQQGSDRAKIAGQNLLATRTNDLGALCQLAFMISTSRTTHPDFGLANEALDQAAKLATTNSLGVDYFRGIVLFQSGKHDEGLTMESNVLAKANDPGLRTNALESIQTMKKFESAPPPHSGGNEPRAQVPQQGPAFKPAPGNGQ